MDAPRMKMARPMVSRQGVVTLHGYDIAACVDRGHLILKDGIGAARRQARLPRVGHGLKRLVVIGADGMVSLAALRWLADQEASFVMLDRDGSVLATTGPVRSSDARLRRAQACAHVSGIALPITRELTCQKLAGQERVACEHLNDSAAAEIIASARTEITTAESIEATRRLEARAAAAYWSAWHNVPVMFPRCDLKRVPDHWPMFGTRQSPLSGSPRLAVNPPNAILNYLYAVLESEARLAAAALGLDPGLGMAHVDTKARDSLACDLMEPVRPQVDAYLLDWITREPLRREWFFEQRNGNCRLMGSFAVRLSETAPTWASAVAPIAEWVARTLWSNVSKPNRIHSPATRLTQQHKRLARGGTSSAPVKSPPRQPSVCRICGATIKPRKRYCASCALELSTDRLMKAAKFGRIAAQTPKAQASRANTQRRHAAAKRTWKKSEQPAWFTEKDYLEQIQPRLGGFTLSVLSSTLGVSEPYAVDIRAGRRVPHPRHWQRLAGLVGIEPK